MCGLESQMAAGLWRLSRQSWGAEQVGRLLRPLDLLLTARGMLFPWAPVFMAGGIGLWLGLPRDPPALANAGMLALGLVAALAGWRGPERWRPVAVAVLCLALGWGASALRAERVAGPVLEHRFYGAVEGRIVDIDRSQSDRLRLTLGDVVLEGIAADRTPRRVRVALHGDQGFIRPEPGLRVMLTGHLAAPEGAVEPGGFDFQRMAWFRSLGAVGYTRTPVLALAPPDPGAARIDRLRNRIATAVREAVPGDPGAFAAAILTGDRSGIGQQTLQNLRDSNLAHLLAISGLHMGLLTAFVFAALRYGIALVPRLALRVPAKKVAAVLALGAAAFYLLLSGGNVATERAFVMVAVMLVAVLADRRALSLRSVAMAALIILCLRPETLIEPGFQMSFAATVALVAGFGAMQGRASMYRLPRWAQPVAALVLSSGLAGLATAPVAAAHFNRIAEYGLLANVLTVPLMGLLVIPAAVLAGLLAPFGGSAPALWLMEQGTRWILFVAAWVAGLEGAVVPVATPPPWVLPVMALGALWLVLARGPVRLAGVVPMLAALWFWGAADRPALLVSADGAVLGLMGPEGRAISSPRGAGFAVRGWLENDGDAADQATAAARPGFSGPDGDRRLELGGWRIAHLKGRSAATRLEAACAEVRLVFLADRAPRAPPAGCIVIDTRILSATGALALAPDGRGGLVLTRAVQPGRAWAPAPRRGGAAPPPLAPPQPVPEGGMPLVVADPPRPATPPG